MITRIDIYRAMQERDGLDVLLKWEWDTDDFEFYNDHLKPKGWILDKEKHECYIDFEGLVLQKKDDLITPFGECHVRWVYFDTDKGVFIAELKES
jgi:hypothetical protein